MWTIARYQPTSFFSLRPYVATSTGGKSLLVPTPFAIKMALLNAAISTGGLAQGRALFPSLRDLRIAVRLPHRILVNKTFVRVLRTKEIKTPASGKANAIARAKANRQWPYQQYIGFREYVYFGGPLELAFEGMPSDELVPLAEQVNYLGKRGGFLQLLAPPQMAAQLSAGFTILTEEIGESFPLGVLQMVDDCGPSLTFEKADIYNRKSQIRAGKDRIFHHVVLPYRLSRFSRGFTLYERIK